jgi:hypothetical protein
MAFTAPANADQALEQPQNSRTARVSTTRRPTIPISAVERSSSHEREPSRNGRVAKVAELGNADRTHFR